jgi:integrase
MNPQVSNVRRRSAAISTPAKSTSRNSSYASPARNLTSGKRKHHRRIARLIFTTIEGRPIHRSTWALIWAPAARKAGTGLHSFRHYFATLLIHSGASVKRVQLALGHSTPTITLNTYVGEWPDTDRQTRSIVDAALGSVPRVRPDTRPRKRVRS